MMLRTAGMLAAAALLLAAGETAMSQTIEMEIAGRTYAIDLLENDAARSLAVRLPLRLRFEDYGNTERIAYLNPKLDTGNAPMRSKPEQGDIAYYAPWGNLAVFVRPFRMSEGLVPLGRMDEAAWRALAQSGSGMVELRLPAAK